MNIIIQSALKTLQKSQYILANLSNDQLSNTSVSPYYSSIGSHIRHILDFYDCILNKDLENRIDLTARSRNKAVENCCNLATEYLNSITEKLKDSDYNINDMVMVTDDLGLGKIEMSYTLAAALSQANSHTIHHYAIINYILNGLNICLEDSDFGYNPTTPKKAIQKN
ncbi:MAG: hypothetical protein ACM31G_11895 [Flavobacteriales bacterium]